MRSFEQRIQRLLFSRSEQRAFLEDVSALIADGVPAPQAVHTMFEIAKGPTKEAAKSILRTISEGQKIADGMQGWFPQSVVEIIRSGEEGGTLTKTMLVASESLAKQAGAIASFVAAVAYPLVVFVLGLGVSVFLKHSVFDNFAAIKPIASWPTDGRMLLMLATFIERWWWLLFLFLVGLGFVIARMLTTLTGELRRVVDNIPLLSLYRNYAGATFMETLGLLLNNGIGFKQALFILQRNTGRYMAWHIYLMQYKLSAGSENIADVLNTGMIQESDILRLRAMGKGKGFEKALLSLGAQAMDRTVKTIKRTGMMLSWLFLALDAMLVIFMIFAIYSVGSFLGT